MARGNVHFQQHAWGYFSFKRFFASGRKNLQFDGFNFRSANRLRVDKVRPAGCFSVLPLLTKTKTYDLRPVLVFEITKTKTP